MRIIRDIVYSAVDGSYLEREAVRALLREDSTKESFLRPDNTFYSGLADYVVKKLGNTFNIEIEEVHDETRIPLMEIDIPVDYLDFPEIPGATLRDYQITAVKKAIYKRRGIIEAAPGAGKSEMASAIIKYATTNSLVDKVFFIAGTRFLMDQAASRFERRGLKGVSRFGGGYRYEPAPIQVCVINSLHRAIQRARYEIVKDFSECGMIILDEVHHLSAKSWVSTVEMCPARYRLGLTATVWDDPSKISHGDLFLLGLTGVPLCYISSKVLRNRGYLAEPLITLLGVNEPKLASRGWKPIYNNGIVKHVPRNSVAISIAKSMYEAGHKILILVNRIKHGLLLTQLLTDLGCVDTYFVKGNDVMYTWRPSGRWDRTRISIDGLAEIVRDTDKCILVATQVADEGVDFPQVSSVIMAAAMKKHRRTVQRLGRGMRAKPGDNRVYIFDFVDGTHDVLLRHSMKRIDTYKIEEMEFSPSLEFTGEKAGADLQIATNLFQWKDVKIKVKEDEDDDDW